MKTMTLTFGEYKWFDNRAEIPKQAGIFFAYSCEGTHLEELLCIDYCENLCVEILNYDWNSLFSTEFKLKKKIYFAYDTSPNASNMGLCVAALNYKFTPKYKMYRRKSFLSYDEDVFITVSGEWIFNQAGSFDLKVESCINSLTEAEVRYLRNGVEPLNKGTVVRNAKDTAGDESPEENAWIRYWERVVGKMRPTECPNENCPNKGKTVKFDGAHVLVNGFSDEMIIPLCTTCNRSKKKGPMTLSFDVDQAPII